MSEWSCLWEGAYQQLLQRYTSESSSSPLKAALDYALETQGSQWRPRLCLSTASMLAGARGACKAVPAALAVEMVHGYSLIHDDLPCMDDSDERRGRPSLHKAFDEATAVLTGDGLLTDAFGVLCEWESEVDDGVRRSWVKVLSKAAGTKGMVLGQGYDVSYRTQEVSVEFIEQVYAQKSATLPTAALHMAALSCGYTEESPVISTLTMVGRSLGVAYQIQDDLEEEPDQELSLVSLVGPHEAYQRYKEHLEKAENMILSFPRGAELWQSVKDVFVARGPSKGACP